MELDGQPVKANHFIFKTLIINSMMAMRRPNLTQQDALMIERELQFVLQGQIAYLEGDRFHPYLEEIVSLMCTLVEAK